MAEIVISEERLQEAEAFLVEFLTEQVPEASFRPGSAVRDLAVKAFANIFAYMKGEVEMVRDRQSLLRISDLTDEDDIAQAADEILSNWFISRKGGQYTHMAVRLHFLQKTDVTIQASDQFWRTNDLVFYIDSDSEVYVIPESDLLPIYDTRGELIDYVVDVPLMATRTGDEYNVEPGVFVRVDSETGLPYFSYAENLSAAEDGKGVESTEELVARAETAPTVRNMINNRSCDTVLQEAYPDIIETLTIGMGEAEMVRDLKTEIAAHILLHTGGFYDTYIEQALTEVEENGVIGGYYPRPDNKAVVFRDPELTYPGLNRKFTDAPEVKPGHVLYIRSGIAGTPRGYSIIEVRDYELIVSSALPFEEAYDELTGTLDPLTYSIGITSPDFKEIELEPGVYIRIAAASTHVDYTDVPVGTSRHIKEPGVIVLQGRPIQDISWVEITDPSAVDGNMINPTTGTIVFSNRVNADPIGPMSEPSLVQYRVDVLNPASAQSKNTVTLIQVGYLGDLGHFDGQNLRVVYKTLSGFNDVAVYVGDRDRRVVSANHLVKARNPVWVEMQVPYRLKPTASGTVDEAEAAEALAKHINEFDPNDVLDVSDISTEFRMLYPDVGAVFPFEIYYYLHAPDGQIASFKTTDVVSIFESESNGVTLTNGADIVAPASMLPLTTVETPLALRSWFAILGISDRTIRYRTTSNLITFLLRG